MTVAMLVVLRTVGDCWRETVIGQNGATYNGTSGSDGKGGTGGRGNKTKGRTGAGVMSSSG